VTVATPADRPVNVPVAEPIVATAAGPALHTPPPELVRLMDEPVQTTDGPLIAAGEGLTVIGAVTKQPVGSV